MTNQMDFIKRIAPYAVQVMAEKKVLASLTLAQACLESNFGESSLSSQYNNFFGIKGSGDNGSVTLNTTEYHNGQPMTVNAAFASYKTPKGCFDRRADLFINGVSWDKNKYKNLIGLTDYRTACKLIQKDGYATDPTYANKLIKVIEQYNLSQYDEQAHNLSRVPDHAKEAYSHLVSSGIINHTADPHRPATAADVWLMTHHLLNTIHTIKTGETLSGIVGTSNPTILKEIASENHLKDPNQIFVGEKIQL